MTSKRRHSEISGYHYPEPGPMPLPFPTPSWWGNPNADVPYYPPRHASRVYVSESYASERSRHRERSPSPPRSSGRETDQKPQFVDRYIPEAEEKKKEKKEEKKKEVKTLHHYDAYKKNGKIRVHLSKLRNYMRHMEEVVEGKFPHAFIDYDGTRFTREWSDLCKWVDETMEEIEQLGELSLPEGRKEDV